MTVATNMGMDKKEYCHKTLIISLDIRIFSKQWKEGSTKY